jgi:hypothetical protein
MPLSVKDGMGAWIDDFAKSDAPQFKGKNKEERRDMAIAAYLTAKRGPEKEEKVRVEAQTAKQKADMDRAMAAFKKRGGKVKKVAPGRAQGAHGKDDLGTGMMGMLNKGDTSRFKTRKKVRSMESTIYEAVDPKMRKVKQLGTLGLVGKADVNKLMMAMKSMDAGKEVPKNQRKIIFDAFGSLIDLVTGDTAVFQKAKKSVKEDIQEDGHTDVASAMTNVKVAMAALSKMSGELAKLKPEDSLPSWWTNKVAIAVDKLDGMADYLDTKVEAKQDSVNELDTQTLINYRKKSNKQRYSNNISKRSQRTLGVDRANKNLSKRNIDKFGDHSPKGVDRMGNRKEEMNIDFGTPESTKFYQDATPGQHEAREVDTKAMSAYMKYAKAKKVDDDSIRMAFDNPNHPESKRMMKNKSFATAFKMYKASIK